jgi:tetratricopeptide (TPR) repeat protein
MFSVIVALAAGFVVGALVSVGFSTWWAGVLPFVAVSVGAYIFTVMRVNRLVQGAMPAVMIAAQKRDLDGAVAILRSIKDRFGRWAPFLSSQIDGQIGSILFMKKDFEKARPYLESSFIRSWDAKLMLAVLRSGALDPKKVKKKELALGAADEVLEKASRFAEKQGMMWSAWAWLHWTNGDAKRAIEILSRGKEKLGETDPHLAQNLLALQNDKKMKMKGYGDQWYALHLEEHPAIHEQRRMQNVRFARR